MQPPKIAHRIFSFTDHANINVRPVYIHTYLSGSKNLEQNSTQGTFASHICWCVNLDLLKMDDFTHAKQVVTFFFDCSLSKYYCAVRQCVCIPVLPYFCGTKLARYHASQANLWLVHIWISNTCICGM